MKKHITFTIPTKNRIDNLRENLQVLIPQLDEDCHLIIIDNCSDRSVKEEISSIIPAERKFGYEVVRNARDISGNANVARCFELAGKEWLFIVGDSKKLTSNVVKTIRRYINEYPKATFINFYYPSEQHSPRNDLVVTKGRLSFLQEMGSLGNVILVGNSLYNMQKIKSVDEGYLYCSSCAPQLVIPLMNLKENDICVLSPERLIESFMTIPDADKRLSYVNHLNGISGILDLPLAHNERLELAKKISGTDVISQPYLWFFKSILLTSAKEGKRKEMFYYFNRLRSSRFYYDHSIATRLKLFFTYLCLKLSFLSNLLLYCNRIRNKVN